MGLMIFGQKFDLGDCFIVLSNCRKSENGYYGAIFSYQLSYHLNRCIGMITTIEYKCTSFM